MEIITTFFAIAIHSIAISLLAFGVYRLYKKILQRLDTGIDVAKEQLHEQKRTTKFMRKVESKVDRYATEVRLNKQRQTNHEQPYNDNVVPMAQRRTGTDNTPVDFSQINNQRDGANQASVADYERD
ncbi:hypothetical protein VAS14_00271 [Vibrio angustum S14]|uniref:Uncharacterized protein n=2 Tax=Photobacterium angustum TaxID=661 RepID=Q1ZJR5_PHOAS|nr:hypothetical protein VAS14_00271 [Vibrio angustum S14] [Photobacterium angustum S14]